jgi:hypothetical protein
LGAVNRCPSPIEAVVPHAGNAVGPQTLIGWSYRTAICFNVLIVPEEEAPLDVLILFLSTFIEELPTHPPLVG